MLRNLFLLTLLGIPACAPSPLYVGVAKQRGTVGEIPRDGQGEPVWEAIQPIPVANPPRLMAPAPGIPVTPPPR